MMEGRATMLQLLNMSFNKLLGPIPDELISSMTSLTMLSAESNMLSGALPSAVGSMVKLRRLPLEMNRISGSLPDSLAFIAEMKGVYLSENLLTGDLPDSLRVMTDLLWLGASHNKLSGPLPDAIVVMAHLRGLRIGDNRLKGCIPEAIGSMTSAAVHVNMSYNKLWGSLPHQMASMSELRLLDMCSNQLRGSLPSSVRSMVKMQRLYLCSTDLAGTIPDSIGSMVDITFLELRDNRISGSMPDQFGHVVNVREIYIAGNRLTGALPDALAFLASLTWLQVAQNQLDGRLPEALGSMAHMHCLQVSENYLRGTIPDVIGSMACAPDPLLFLAFTNQLSGSLPSALSSMSFLVLMISKNRLRGRIPDGMGSMSVNVLILDYNQLSGPIPAAIAFIMGLGRMSLHDNALSGSMPSALQYLATCSVFHAGNNKLSGSIGNVISEQMFITNQNQLTGSLPALRSSAIEGLFVSGNKLEGTLSHLRVKDIAFLGVSREAHESQGLHGVLPLDISRADSLQVLTAAHQNLEGVIPPLIGSIGMLALHDNNFEVFSGAHLKKDGTSAIFVCSNRLSCHAPMCNDVSTKISLVALGNHLRRPRTNPGWISPLERDSLFWQTDNQGSWLLAKVLAASCVLAVSVAVKRLRPASLAAANVGRHIQIASSFLLYFLAEGTVVRAVIFLIFLLPWDLYKCPQVLEVASVCFRDGRWAAMLACSLWAWFSFRAPAALSLKALIACCRDHKDGESTERSLLIWIMWPLLALVLSLPGILCQVGKTVPGIAESHFLQVLNGGLGAANGLLVSCVIPYLANKLTPSKCAYVSVANMLVNCVFPAMVTVYLDTRCFGNWVRMWEPCRMNPVQFEVALACRAAGKLQHGQSLYQCSLEKLTDALSGTGVAIKILQTDEICNPRTLGQTSTSHCVQLVLLRLQDIWLGKFVVSGLIVQAWHIRANTTYASIDECVGKLAALLVYAVMSSGHLPLMMALLCLVMLSENLVIAISLANKRLKHQDQHQGDVVTPSFIIGISVSCIIHLASSTADPLSCAMVMLVISFHLGKWLHQTVMDSPPMSMQRSGSQFQSSNSLA